MRWRLAVALLLVSLCLPGSRVGAETWQDLLSRADSLAVAGCTDSADATLEAALSSAQTQHVRSDSTVEFSLYERGETRRYYFPSYAHAESVYARALRVQERIVGQCDPGYAKLLNDLGELYRQQRRYQEAEPLYTRALAIREKALGSDHTDVAMSLHNLARIYWNEGRQSEAEPLCKRALAIWEKALGPDHPDMAEGLDGLAVMHLTQGRYPEAESLFKRALAIREKSLGPDRPDVATSLVNLAFIYRAQGRFLEAEPLCKRALAIREKALGPGHPDVATSLSDLANLYRDQGRYPEAGPLYTRVLAIRERVWGSDHPDVATSLGSLAELYCEQGKYSEAEPLYTRALAIREKVRGSDHPDVAGSLGSLAILYCGQGRYSEAEPLFERALAIFETALGRDCRDVAVTVINLADLYVDQGRYSEAEPLYKRALAIFEKAVGPYHSEEVAGSLNNLALLYVDQGRYSEAERLCQRALAILEKVLGPDHPYVAAGLNSLATLYVDQGRYSEAEPLHERALAIWEKALGPDHSSVALCLEDFGDLYRQLRQHATAVELAGRACRIRHKNFVENSIGLSEKDALTYSQFLRASLSKYLSCYLDLGSPNPATALEAADLVLACKGQVSDGILERQKSMVEGTDSTTLSLAESLRYTRFRLAKLFVEGSGEDVSAYRAEVDSLDMFAKRLEAELSRRSAAFRGYVGYREVNAGRIASLLPRNSVLAEYVRYAYRDLEAKRNIHHYLVVVIPTDRDPRVIDLGAASQIDSTIGTYRAHMKRVATSGKAPTIVEEQEYRACVQDLYGRIWRPIAEYVSDMDLVFIAPDGALNMVSFAALIGKEGKYLIEEHPLHYLSAGRDLVRLSDETPPGDGLLALGDPDYSAIAASRLQYPGIQETISTEPSDGIARNVRVGCGRLEDISVPPLPGTRKEVDLIAFEWKKASSEPAYVYFGAAASEERFKKEAQGKRVIHLATHGYFLEGACQPEVTEGSAGHGSGFGRSADYVGENPLLLSGLLLAGANLHGDGADSLGCEDGILTAYEISGMKLEGTELVVLSACETGLGRVEEGEGVYGLRRAFQMAGARTVVSALWPVSDEATADMMSGFYERRGESIPKAIRRIQLEKIRGLRRDGKVDHPFTWAGFIAVGDWR